VAKPRLLTRASQPGLFAIPDKKRSYPHVVFVLTQDRGGPVDLTVSLARELADRDDGPRVTVVAPPPLSSAVDVSDLLVPLHVRSKTDAATARRVAATLHRLDPDVVHAQDRRAGLVVALARPVASRVTTYHGLPEDTENSWVLEPSTATQAPSYRSRAVMLADAVLARVVPVTVTPSEYMATFLRDHLRVPADRVHVVPNGARLPPARPPLGPVRTLTYVGQLGPVKSVGTLLEALARVRTDFPWLRLRVVGDGALRQRLEERASRDDLCGSVEFLGYRTDVGAQLAMADAFILPSVNENQPMALLEAMGAGLACVASGVGSIPEVLSDVGLVVPPGDVSALAAALARLAGRHSPAPHLGAAAAQRAREFYSIGRCADSHLALYDALPRREAARPSLQRAERIRAGGWPVEAPVRAADHRPGPTPSFSVLIAAYQAAGTVRAAVDSALAQTHAPMEVIVCDDGSTDDLLAVLVPYGHSIQVLRKTNGGESTAKNAAAAAAHGDFVVLLDADDSWRPRRLEAMASLIRARPDLDVVTTNATVMVDGRDEGPYYPLRTRFRVDDQRAAALHSNFVFGHYAVRRSRWEDLGGFDESLHRVVGVDWEFLVRLIMSGSSVGLVDSPLAVYNLHPDSLTGDEVRLWQHRRQLTARFMRRHELTQSEQRICEEQIRLYEWELQLAQARSAVHRQDADARRLSLAVAGSPHYPWSTRAKAMAAAIWPEAASRRPVPPRTQ